MLIKNPRVSASFKVLDLDAERKLLYEVLRDRKITVRERVAKMERNLADLARLREANGVSDKHKEEYTFATVVISDLMIASLYGAQPMDMHEVDYSTCPVATIDPEWLEYLQDHIQEEIKSFKHLPPVGDEAPGTFRAVKRQGGAPKGYVPKKIVTPPPLPPSPRPEVDDNQGDVVGEEGENQLNATNVMSVPSLSNNSNNKTKESCITTPSKKKPMLQSVASRLRKTMMHKKRRKRGSDEGEALLVTNVEDLGLKKKNHRRRSMDNQEDPLVIEQQSKRKNSFSSRVLGSFISMKDVFGFGGQKEETFEVHMKDLLAAAQMKKQQEKLKKKAMRRSRKHKFNKKDREAESASFASTRSADSCSVILEDDSISNVDRDEDLLEQETELENEESEFNQERRREIEEDERKRAAQQFQKYAYYFKVGESLSFITRGRRKEPQDDNDETETEPVPPSNRSGRFGARSFSSKSRKRRSKRRSKDLSNISLSQTSSEASMESFKRYGDMSGGGFSVAGSEISELTILEEEEEDLLEEMAKDQEQEQQQVHLDESKNHVITSTIAC